MSLFSRCHSIYLLNRHKQLSPNQRRRKDKRARRGGGGGRSFSQGTFTDYRYAFDGTVNVCGNQGIFLAFLHDIGDMHNIYKYFTIVKLKKHSHMIRMQNRSLPYFNTISQRLTGILNRRPF